LIQKELAREMEKMGTMEVTFGNGKYKITCEQAWRLIDVAAKIDDYQHEVSEEEEKEIGKALEACKGDVSCAEAMLRKMVLKIPEMIDIPAGTFKMGSMNERPEERPVRDVKISAFRIGKYEVTNKEFGRYFRLVGEKIKIEQGYLRHEFFDEGLNRYPAVRVTYDAAVKYCEWLSRETGRKFRLPTEAEWEYAARGTDGRKYPWGNKWDPSFAAVKDSTFPVGSHPKDASPFGVMDMAGNVTEWTSDWYADGYDPKDLMDPKGPEKGKAKVFKTFPGENGPRKVQRGGSCHLKEEYLANSVRSASRFSFPLDLFMSFIGFRVAEDLK
jgi:formylglycine-generating enzyme required for sulfatase activity